MTAEPWGIEGARDALIRKRPIPWSVIAAGAEPVGPDAPPESDLTLLRLELDACHQEITRLRFVLGLVADALHKADEQ